MSGLFGRGPSLPSQQPVQIRAASVETDADNAGIFERIRRAAAYGKQKTFMAQGALPPATIERKTLLGSL